MQASPPRLYERLGFGHSSSCAIRQCEREVEGCRDSYWHLAGYPSMTTALESLYSRFHKTARLPDSLAERASAPLLISPGASWTEAPFKVLIVGQETSGWRYTTHNNHLGLATINSFSDFSASPGGVEAMICAYQTFFHESEYWKRNSACWRAFRICSEPERKGGCGASSPNFQTSSRKNWVGCMEQASTRSATWGSCFLFLAQRFTGR